MSDRCLTDDLTAYRLDNGYGIEVLEPLKRHRMTYVDEARANSVNLEFCAAGPAIAFGDRTHFEQPMKVKGTLVLGGTQHVVDCYTVRDRSWGKPRPELNLRMPPYSWMSGTFNELFAFNCGRFDDAIGNPEIKGRFELPEERLLAGGWLFKDGRAAQVVHAKKRCRRDHFQSPVSIE